MGFTLLSKRPLDELDAVMWEMQHEPTGARLIWLDRAEENKTFCIAFQTQPRDDTGVFHILEHSVLCGSERYPVKDPYVELMKTSLNTFLNAITFPDKTLYPFSSRNEQDFRNLLRVYLDAVFHPLLHQKPEIFAQEGWHYEVSTDRAVSCKGVVFNEMKGVFSSPDAQLEYEMNRRLFPDTCYRWVAGGDPEHISELSYEQFVAVHQQWYHPSNAYIFLDGALDLDEVLKILDEEYLSACARRTPPPPVPMQTPVDGGTATLDYALSRQESLSGHCWLGLGYGAGTFRDREQLTALQALCDVLCGDNESPLKRCLLGKGLAQDVTMQLNSGVLQPTVLLTVKNCDENRLEEAAAAIQDELARLVREGLNHQRICATLDNLEFNLRERQGGWMPQGLLLATQVYGSWLYGGDPAENLCVGTLFWQLRQQCSEGYFEQLIDRVLLDNSHRCRVILRPSHTLGDERAARESGRIRAATEGWDAGMWEAVRYLQTQTEAWQTTPDSTEALATIPRLRLEQIEAEPRMLPTEVETLTGLSVLRHTLPTHGITYLNLYFALDDLEREAICDASYLCELLGALDTTSIPAVELSGKIRACFGSLQSRVEAYGEAEHFDRCRVFLCVSASMLNTKVEQGVLLLSELLQNTRLKNHEKMLEILRQRRAALTQQIAGNGSSFAMTRAGAAFRVECVVQEYAGGIEYLQWLKTIEDQGMDAMPVLAERLQALLARVFTGARLTISVTSDAEEAAGKTADLLARTLPIGAFTRPDRPVVQLCAPRREGIVLPTDISFTAMSGLFPDANRGIARVMKRVVFLDHLWNSIRVQGGAYGTGMVLRNNGLASLYSYRDPSAAHSLACYREIPAFLKTFTVEVQSAIIGAIAESDPLLTPRDKGKTADAYHWKKLSHETLCRIWQEILTATGKDVATYAERMERFVGQSAVCVLGPRSQLEQCGAELETILSI